MSGGDQRYIAGPFQIDLEGCEVIGPDGSQKLESLTMAVLACLLRHAGEVVSLNQIVDEVWRGGVAADNAVHKRIAQLRKVFDDDARDPHYIETIARRGYRWLPAVIAEPVAAVPELSSAHPAVAQSVAAIRRGRRLLATLGSLLIGVAIGVVVLLWPQQQSGLITQLPTEPASRTLLIMPLTVRGETDPVLQELLVESFREVLVEDSGINVLSRQAAERMLENQQTIRESAARFGVELLIQPSLVSSPGSVRLLTLAATDVESGFEVWADRVEIAPDSGYQSGVEGAFRAARGLRQRLVGGTSPETDKPAFADSTQYRDYALAQFKLNQRTPTSLEQSIATFRRLEQSNPGSYAVTLGLARALVAFAERHPEQRSELLEEAEYLAEKALMTRPGAASVKALLGWIRYSRGQRQAGLSELSAAVTSNPDLPWAQEQLARALVAANQPQRAEMALSLALSSQPLDVNLTLKLAELKSSLGEPDAGLGLLEDAGNFPGSSYEVALMKAQIDYLYGRFERAGRAAEAAEAAAAAADKDERPAARLALCLAAMGQFDQARHWLSIAKMRSPQSPFVRSIEFYLAYFSGSLATADDFVEDPGSLTDRTLTLDQRVGIGLFGLREVALGRWVSADSAFRRLDLLAPQRAVTQSGDLFFLGSWLLAAERSNSTDLAQLRTSVINATQSMLDAGWDLPAVHYYGARVFMIAGESERANQQLQQARRRGWIHYQEMLADPARERMRSLPDYGSLEAHAQASSLAQARAYADR